MANLKVVKKAGGYNEKGECIIPMEYDKIKRLKTGVYVATNRIEDGFLFKDTYHLYTEKGELKYEYEGYLTEVLYDENEEIFAVEITDLSKCECHLVEIDYEKNLINKLYKNSIDSVERLSNNCIRLFTLEGFTEIFSCELKKIIASLATGVKIHFVGKQGFILEDKDKQTAFINLEGTRILGFNWDHMVLGDEFITVVKEIGNGEFNFGLYTYDGKEVLPCIYWGMKFIPGITPELCRIDGAKVWLFNTHRKVEDVYYDELIKVDIDVYHDELIKVDDEAVLSISGDDVFMSDVSISVYEGSNVIIKQKNKATLYKLEMNSRRKIKAVVVCEADKIEKLRDYGLYRVYKGRKKGMCNKNGTMIEPLRFMVRKE